MTFGKKFKSAAQSFSKSVDAGIAKGKDVYGKVQEANKQFEQKQDQFRVRQDKKLDRAIGIEKQKAASKSKKLKLQELRQKNRGGGFQF